MIHVRPLNAADKPEWARLWHGYLAYYETKLSPDIYDTYFDRLIGDDPQDFHCLIAEIDGAAVGLTHYVFHRHGWKVENTCYLQDLYADPEVRGQGVGRALMEAVYRASDEAEAPSVYWLTQDFNTEARKLYDRVGALSPFIKYTRPA